MVIRQLNRNDAVSFRAVRLQFLRDHPYDATPCWEDELSKPLTYFADTLFDNILFGAWIEQDLSGTVGLRFARSAKTSHKALLWGMYVQPTFRRRGVGRALLQHALDHAQFIVEELVLSVSASNIDAFNLYKKSGFEIYGYELNAIKIGQNYSNEYLMRIDLKNLLRNNIV